MAREYARSATRADTAPEAPAVQAGPARSRGRCAARSSARFGAQPNGARLDGIEIAGARGRADGAAADGDVVYAGSDLPAYGTLVLVRHADGYVTAYGYARARLGARGPARARRQKRWRRRGDGRALLFQVRRGREAVDPAAAPGAPDASLRRKGARRRRLGVEMAGAVDIVRGLRRRAFLGAANPLVRGTIARRSRQVRIDVHFSRIRAGRRRRGRDPMAGACHAIGAARF